MVPLLRCLSLSHGTHVHGRRRSVHVGMNSSIGGSPERLAEFLELESVGCELYGSRFYRDLERRMAEDVRAGGVVWDVLEPFAHEHPRAAYTLRLLGGVHRMVLCGDAPELAKHYPSTGGDGDVDAVWPAFAALLAASPPAVEDALRRPPQTNEVGRTGALVPGMLVVATETGLPLRIREIGSSAGLNLRIDQYWFGQDGAGWGRADSPVRLPAPWGPAVPPFSTPAVIADRRGCDRDPIDATSEDAGLTLLSYVWPGQEQRFVLLRAALDIARETPVAIDQAEAASWVEAQLAERVPGTATVLYHSVVWQYLDAETRSRVTGALEAAGARATNHDPVAWLRLEPTPEAYIPAELRLTLWPGGEERLLATSGFHGGAVNWMA